MTILSLALLGAFASSVQAAAPGADGERGARRAAPPVNDAARERSRRTDVAVAAGALATAVTGAALAAYDSGRTDTDAGTDATDNQSSEADKDARRHADRGTTGDSERGGGRDGRPGGHRRAGKDAHDRQCFRFSEQTVGTAWRLHEAIPISFGAVQVTDFYIDGTRYTPQPGADSQRLTVNQSRIAQGKAPEMHGSFVNVTLQPTQPLRGVRVKFAQQLGVTGQLPASLEVNGVRHDLRGSLAQADGLTLGDPKRGEARFRIVLVPDPSTPQNPSYWHRGTLEVRAVSGAIETLSFGAQLFNFDDLCIHR